MQEHLKCDRIYFELPSDHSLNSEVIYFQKERQTIHNEWQAFRSQHGGRGVYANDRVHGLSFDDGDVLPKGWHRPAAFQDNALAPDRRTKEGKIDGEQMDALPRMPGGAELSHLISEHLDITDGQHMLGGYAVKDGHSPNGFMIHYIGYEIYKTPDGDRTIISVPDIESAPSALPGLLQLKNSEYHAIIEAVQEVQDGR